MFHTTYFTHTSEDSQIDTSRVRTHRQSVPAYLQKSGKGQGIRGEFRKREKIKTTLQQSITTTPTREMRNMKESASGGQPSPPVPMFLPSSNPFSLYEPSVFPLSLRVWRGLNVINGVFLVGNVGEVDFVSRFLVEVGLVDFRRFW